MRKPMKGYEFKGEFPPKDIFIDQEYGNGQMEVNWPLPQRRGEVD